MLVLACNQPVYMDVDDTLVKWGYAGIPVEGSIPITCEGFTQYLVPHKKHIEQLKAHKARGHTIIVWSQGGWMWAEAVVKALELEEFVDLCIEKPQLYYDDLPCQDFMGKRMFFKDE